MSRRSLHSASVSADVANSTSLWLGVANSRSLSAGVANSTSLWFGVANSASWSAGVANSASLSLLHDASWSKHQLLEFALVGFDNSWSFDDDA